jgi:hypothetical protein
MARTARKRIVSDGRSWLSGQRRWFRDSGGIGGTGEGFAPLRVLWICALWALAHSVLASKRTKDLARRISGSRYRDGLYRFAYNAQSVVTLLWAALRFSRLPDRDLYHVRPPWSWLLRASQAASLGVLLSGVRVMGILRFAGLTPLIDLLAGRDVRPAPEAQGPPLGSMPSLSAPSWVGTASYTALLFPRVAQRTQDDRHRSKRQHDAPIPPRDTRHQQRERRGKDPMQDSCPYVVAEVHPAEKTGWVVGGQERGALPRCDHAHERSSAAIPA